MIDVCCWNLGYGPRANIQGSTNTKIFETRRGRYFGSAESQDNCNGTKTFDYI